MLKLKIVEKKEPITNDWPIERVAREYPPFSWESVFKNAENEIKDVSDIIQEDRKVHKNRIFPDNCNLFRAFHMTPIYKVRVVVFGQDPYFNLTQDGTPLATGMAFSVPKTAPIPPSLRNMFKELKDSVPEFKTPNHGDLTNWALQGVLLLNACLTVREGEPDCFKQIWEGFLKKVINAILEVNPNCIFVAWGGNAQKIAKKFVGERAPILTGAHPSPLSAYRGFFGCKHFPKINELLIEQGSEPIDWNVK